jgi:hypothetical protein
MATAWDEDKLACLWGRAKTNRLLASGALRPYHTAADGRQYFTEAAVMAHYKYKSPAAPGRACCTCCGHCAEPGSAGRKVAKAFGADEARYGDGYELDYTDGEYPDEYLEGDYPPDEDDEDEDADLDADEDEGGLDEPGDAGVGDRDDDLGGGPLEDYIDGRIKVLEADERLAAALADRADLWALENSSLGLAVGRLRLRDSVRRWLGG